MTQLKNIRPETKGMIIWAFAALGAWSLTVASAYLLDGLTEFVVSLCSLGLLLLAIARFVGWAFPLPEGCP